MVEKSGWFSSLYSNLNENKKSIAVTGVVAATSAFLGYYAYKKLFVYESEDEDLDPARIIGVDRSF